MYEKDLYLSKILMTTMDGEKLDLIEDLLIENYDVKSYKDLREFLSNLFDKVTLDLIIYLLAENHSKIKSKLQGSCDYLCQTKMVSELSKAESELVKFQSIKEIDP